MNHLPGLFIIFATSDQLTTIPFTKPGDDASPDDWVFFAHKKIRTNTASKKYSHYWQ
ncbi:MAG TPA: hypothetical protein PJ988_01065 [Anaerolinea sp.]|nr:hypothetical protein [Anaerolinea sp.]